MPIYEYQCAKCETVTEVMQKFSDPPLTQCEACGGSVSKLISRSAFHLKGTGWYQTDYKKTKAPESAKKEEGKKAEPAPKTNTETAPAAASKPEKPKAS